MLWRASPGRALAGTRSWAARAERPWAYREPPSHIAVSLQICSQANAKCIASIHSAPLPHVSEPLGSAFGLTTDQPPKFGNKIRSEKGQIKPFTSWVCIKWGKQSRPQPWGTSLPRKVFKTFLSWRNCRVQLSSCKHHRRLERTNIRITSIPCYITNFVCDLSNSSASPGPHFPIHFLKVCDFYIDR